MRRVLVIISSMCLSAALAAEVSVPKNAKGSAPAPLSLRTIVTGLFRPVFVTHAPGDESRQFVVQQLGQIVIVRNGSILKTPFLNIAIQISAGGERGLLGLAFHPQYQTNGRFFVYYTDPDGDITIAEYHVSSNPDVADPDSGEVIISIDHSLAPGISFANHNGGTVAFGPNDGLLYFGTGDGGSGNDPFNKAQDLSMLLGKIGRIDVDNINPGGQDNYGIPLTNPFVSIEGARPEIWHYGVRNPWRFTFDRATGDMYIGDVGQNAYEEVDFQPANNPGGLNYGWKIAEGFQCRGGAGTCGTDPGLTPPIIDYPHTSEEPSLSVTGGYVYRGSRIPGLQGTYFYADYVIGKIWSLRYSGGVVSEFQERTPELDPEDNLLDNISSFGEDPHGELYICDFGVGALYKIITIYGDVNDDDAIDAVDVQIVVNGALGLDTEGTDPDINDDTLVNAEDVQLAINAALGQF
jgi:glucose/arabinose dehydrogenase